MMAAKGKKTSIDESENHCNSGATTCSASSTIALLAPFPCENFLHDGDCTIHVTVVYKSSCSTRFTSSTIPTRSTRTGQIGGTTTSTTISTTSPDDTTGEDLFCIYATLNGLDTIAQSTQRIVENHCPWLLDELSEEEDVLVRYGDANRAQRRQLNIDQQPIINVHLSNYNSGTKNIFSPAAITRDVLKCGTFVSFLYDYRLLMRHPPLAAATTCDEVNNNIHAAQVDKIVASNGPNSSTYSMEFLTTLNLNQLKELCKVKRVTVSGPKKDLIDRLLNTGNVQDDSVPHASKKCLITQQTTLVTIDNTDSVVRQQKDALVSYNQKRQPGMDTPKAVSFDSTHVPEKPPATTSVVNSCAHVHQKGASRSLNHGTSQEPKHPFAQSDKSNTNPRSEKSGFLSKSHGKTNASTKVTSLHSTDSLPPQQQIALASTQKSNKKSRKSSLERMAPNDAEALKKKPKKSSNFNLHLPVASTAQELTAQNSNPSATLNSTTELQTNEKSAVADEKQKKIGDDPVVKLSSGTTHNDEVTGNTLITQPSLSDALHISNKPSSRRKDKAVLQHQKQQTPKATPIAALHVPERSAVTASAAGSTAKSRVDKSRQSSPENKITSSNLHPAAASTELDPTLTAATKVSLELGTSSEAAWGTKKRKSAPDKSSEKKVKAHKRQKVSINLDGRVTNATSASSTPVTKQPFHATSTSTQVPVPMTPNAAPTGVSIISEKNGTTTSVVDSIVDVHQDGVVRSSNYGTQHNKSNTYANSDKIQGTSNAKKKVPSLHSGDSLPPERHASLAAIQRNGKKKGRKSSDNPIAPNETEVPKMKPMASTGSSPVIQQSAAASKVSVVSEKGKRTVDEPQKKKKKATKKRSDINPPTDMAEFSNQANCASVTQPSLLLASVNADMPNSKQKDKDVSYPQQQQQQPAIDPLNAAPITPTRDPENLDAAPSLNSSAGIGKEGSVLHSDSQKSKLATSKNYEKAVAQMAIRKKHSDTPKEKVVFSNQASSSSFAQPSPHVTFVNANIPDSQQKDKTSSSPQKQQPSSDPPLKAIPISSSRLPEMVVATPSIIDASTSTNKESEKISHSNTAFSNIGTSGEGFSMDHLTALTKIQLKELCKIIKIPHSGSKKDLVDRLLKNRNSSEGRESNTPIINTDEKETHSDRGTTNTDLQQSTADKENIIGDSAKEELLASHHISPIIPANEMLQSGRQNEGKDLSLKLPTNTDFSNNNISSGDCNTMDYLTTLTNAQLKKICNARNIPHTGTKKALIDRLIKNGSSSEEQSSKGYLDLNAPNKMPEYATNQPSSLIDNSVERANADPFRAFL